MDNDAAGFKLFGKVIIQPPAVDGHQQDSVVVPTPPQQQHPAATPAPSPSPSSPLPPPPLLPAAAATGEPPLPCPRCGSRETKFCYFNNYNVRQPRHLCRSCRRYWTAGGALRRVASASPARRRPRPSPAARSAVSASAASSAAEEAGGER